jgi:hypothetical protein
MGQPVSNVCKGEAVAKATNYLFLFRSQLNW